MLGRPLLAVVLAILTGSAAAQLYRWTDEKGRVHITDTPPPASARDVQKKSPSKGAASGGEAQPQNYELAQAQKNFPVSLFTAPNCTDPCSQARAHLNKRGIPFREVLVADRGSFEELKKLASGKEVPVLVVGRSVHEGFQAEAYDALLDSARYPKAGVLPPRAQAAPELPANARPAMRAEPAAPAAEEPKPTGPYAPRAAPQR